MPSTIVAHEQAIAKVFSDDYVFRIPSYQRPYAWTTDQAEELFDDLRGAMTADGGRIDDLPPYFLGSIVLIKSENDPKADVVDGQQRLTTLVVLLSAIRANVEGKDAQDISGLLYESGSQIKGTVDRFRLTLRERDADFFRKYVQKETGMSELLKLNDAALSDSQRNLIKNARLFAERLEGLSMVDRVMLAQFIVTRCFLVAVATPDEDSAYRIFSVLNSRGLDLSATDILKAEIIGKITPETARDAYTKKWEEIEEDLGRESFGDLFSHIRMAYRKAKPKGTLLKEFREHVSAKGTPKSLIDDIIVPMAAAYEFLTDANYESTRNAESVNEALKWLGKLEFKDWVPPALAFALRYKDDAARMASFVVDLERLGYGMLLAKFGINERIERFAKLTGAIEVGEDLSASGSPLQLTPPEQYAVYEALSGLFYSSFSARARTTVLIRLDALIADAGATYDYPVISVEHVLPQKPAPDSEWVKWVPDSARRLSCVHLLGNLALLSRKTNAAASNYEFERKKKAYFTRKGGVSPFALTTQVLGQQHWTYDVIQARQKELLAKLESHWRLQNRKTTVDELLESLVGSVVETGT